ncbi:hypothetical protein ONZ45_g16469 [Pleurotus djamor]|nr:hypothetical protein ONZ45_g16469 [Pleurotus djamor]
MTTASSRTLVAGAPTIEDGGVLRFSRNTNDTINTAATYRYFMNLEEEIARKKQEQGEKKDEKPSLPGTSQKTDLPEKQSNDKKPVVTSEQVEDTKEVESRANDKGKRKVTFVQPEPVEIINTDLTAEAADENSVEVSDPSADMVFAMEEGNEIPSVVEGSSSVLPLIEPPSSRPPRPRTRANVLAGGLPESFAALRPASLPLPSHIRPPRSHQGVDSSSSQAAMLSPPPRASNSNKPKAPPTLPDIPSSAPSDGAHVVTRRLRKSFDDMVQEEEEAHFNGDRSNDFFVGSMPISIRQPQAQKPSLSLASYQPTAAIASEEPAAAPPTRTESATAAH